MVERFTQKGGGSCTVGGKRGKGLGAQRKNEKRRLVQRSAAVVSPPNFKEDPKKPTGPRKRDQRLYDEND